VTAVRRRHRRPHLRGVSPWLVVVAVLAGLLTGCSGDGPDHDLTAEALEGGPAQGAEQDPGLAPFYEQDVTWRECRVDMECTEVEVPVDYDSPGGPTIQLALLRVPASDPEQRVGALLVNPGGPGVPGIDYASRASAAFGDEVTAAFDIVGFDPRGVGASTPLECASQDLRDEVLAVDPDPETAQEVEAADGLMREVARGCLEDDAGLTRRVSTEDQARDLDVIRAVALDQDRLVYYGASYGTFLGAWYAELFPDRVGRLVLDGGVDPDLGTVDQAFDQARGFEGALRSYATECVAEGDCYLGDTVDDATVRVRQFLDDLDAEPLPAGDRELTEGLAVQGIWAPLYRRDTWPLLDVALSQGLRGNGAPLLTVVDQFLGRGPDGFIDNSIEMYFAITCADRGVPPSEAEVAALVPRFERAAPTFGSVFASGTSACREWPVRADDPTPALDGKGAAPILVVGTTGDPATPLVWSESLASQLDSGVLVRREGEGHTGYRKGNECVDDTVEAYLVSGEVPDGTVDC